MKTKEILIQARDLIANPKRWTTGYYARDQYGRTTEPTSPAATCFCSVGALRKVTGVTVYGRRTEEYREALAALRGTKIANGMVTTVNDTKGHFVVMKMFNEAIENA